MTLLFIKVKSITSNQVLLVKMFGIFLKKEKKDQCTGILKEVKLRLFNL